MEMILKDKSDIVEYFKNGCKKENQLKIGVEHEKFFFENESKNRINFSTVLKIFNYLTKFGWKPVKERENTISLSVGIFKNALSIASLISSGITHFPSTRVSAK